MKTKTRELGITEFPYREIAQMRDELQELRQTVDFLNKEHARLAMDEERLNWLVNNASISILRKDEDGEEWWVELDYTKPMLAIDAAMKGEVWST